MVYISIRSKKKIEIQVENQTLASIHIKTISNFMKKFLVALEHAATEAEEFYEIYNLNVVVIQRIKRWIRKRFTMIKFLELRKKKMMQY